MMMSVHQPAWSRAEAAVYHEALGPDRLGHGDGGGAAAELGAGAGVGAGQAADDYDRAMEAAEVEVQLQR